MGYSFKYNHDAVSGLFLDVRGRYGSVMAALETNDKKSQQVMEGDAWLGNKADNVRDYLGNVYPAINAGFAKAMEALESRVETYNSDCLAIDGDKHAVIHEEKVLKTKTEIYAIGRSMMPIGDEANEALGKVSDIAPIRKVELTQLGTMLDKVQEELQDLTDSINKNESSYEKQFSQDIADLIKKTVDFITYAQAQKDITKFSAQSLSGSKEYLALAKAYDKVSNSLEADEAKIAKARKTNDAMVAELQKEYEERVQKAQRLKFLAGVVCVVATVAVSAVTCGAGAVVAGAITGAVTGGISAGIGSYADQQIGTLACPGKIDKGQIFMKAFEGAVVGGVTGAIGGKFDSLKVAGSGLKAVGQKAVVAGCKKIAQGVASRGLEGVFHGELDGGKVFSLKQMAGDFAGGFAGSVVTSGISSLMPKSWKPEPQKGTLNPVRSDSTQLVANQTLDLGTRMERAVGNGFIATASNTASIFASESVKSGSVTEGWNKATDVERIATDFATSTATAAGTEYINYRQDQRTLEKLQQQVDEGAQNYNNLYEKSHEKWRGMGVGETKNGGPTFSGNEGCIGETKIEQTYTKDHGPSTYRAEDYQNAFNRMVETGQIDPNDFDISQINGGNVTRLSDGKEYVLHHLDDYDVRSGQTSMQLVEKDLHDATKPHAGATSQIEHAYEDYNAEQKLNRYNNLNGIAQKDAKWNTTSQNYNRKQFGFLEQKETPEGKTTFRNEGRYNFAYAQG